MKTLAQSIPNAGTLTDLYAPASVANILGLVVCNQSKNSATFRVSIALLAAADTLRQYLFYDIPLDPNETLEWSPDFGHPLAATDVIRVLSSNGQISFNLKGEGP